LELGAWSLELGAWSLRLFFIVAGETLLRLSSSILAKDLTL